MGVGFLRRNKHSLGSDYSGFEHSEMVCHETGKATAHICPI